MSNKDIFQNEIFDLPIIRNNQNAIIFLQNLYSEYLKLIQLFDGELGDAVTTRLDVINNECNAILNALNLYYIGKTAESYKVFENCMLVLQEKQLLEIGSLSSNFYRIQTSANKNLPKGRLFHIPFEMREKVGTQRYSIPGLPCLYMADSIFVAWEELNRPNFDEIHVSRFSFETSDLRILYLNVNSKDLRKRCFVNEKTLYVSQLVNFLSCWPLLAACSLRVINRDAVFKEEYIVPQMVLQFVISNKGIDGVQFKSNRIIPNQHNVGSFNNLVLPASSISETGYCKNLSSKVKMTQPISWSLLDISDPEKKFSKKEEHDIDVEDVYRSYYIEVIKDEKTNYLESKFGILEEKLLSMSVDYVNK